jgi:hypothetical protein
MNLWTTCCGSVTASNRNRPASGGSRIATGHRGGRYSAAEPGVDGGETPEEFFKRAETLASTATATATGTSPTATATATTGKVTTMPSFKVSENKFGIKVPIGRYYCRFIGTEDRKPFADRPTEQRMAWAWEILDGAQRGQRIEQESGVEASMKTICLQVLCWLHGRQIRVDEQVETESRIGKTYWVSVGVNPKSDKGSLHVAHVDLVDGQPATSPSQAPAPPRPPQQSGPPPAPPAPPAPTVRMFWCLDAEGGVISMPVPEHEVQQFIDEQKKDPRTYSVCLQGGTEWKPAVDHGFTSKVPF